jgi:hypothetical protein
MRPPSHVSEAHQAQDAAEHAVGIEMLARELPCGERVSGVVPLHGFQAPHRTVDVGVGQQAESHRNVPTETGIFHHHWPSGGEVAAAAIAKPTTSPQRADGPNRAELTAGLPNIATIRIGVPYSVSR